MAFTTARAPKPEKQKGRPGKSGPSNLYINNGDQGVSTHHLRHQLLVGRYGVAPTMASTLAGLAWGGAA